MHVFDKSYFVENKALKDIRTEFELRIFFKIDNPFLQYDTDLTIWFFFIMGISDFDCRYASLLMI